MMTLKLTADASKAAIKTACDISKEIVEKATKPIPLVDQAAQLASEAIDSAKIMAEKVGEKIPDAAAQAAQDITGNYGKAAAVIVGAAGIAMVAAPAVLALPALGAVGFSASGPVAGSIAAATQSGLGSVVAPSLFATCQSAAMGGYGAATVFGAVQVVGGAMAASAGTVIGRMESGL